MGAGCICLVWTGVMTELVFHYRKDWEKFQTKVSRQLLARYFYGCEHSIGGVCIHFISSPSPSPPIHIRVVLLSPCAQYEEEVVPYD